MLNVGQAVLELLEGDQSRRKLALECRKDFCRSFWPTLQHFVHTLRKQQCIEGVLDTKTLLRVQIKNAMINC